MLAQKTGDDLDRESSDSAVAETCVAVAADGKIDHIGWLHPLEGGYDVAQGVDAAYSSWSLVLHVDSSPVMAILSFLELGCLQILG